MYHFLKLSTCFVYFFLFFNWLRNFLISLQRKNNKYEYILNINSTSSYIFLNNLSLQIFHNSIWFLSVQIYLINVIRFWDTIEIAKEKDIIAIFPLSGKKSSLSYVIWKDQPYIVGGFKTSCRVPSSPSNCFSMLYAELPPQE